MTEAIEQTLTHKTQEAPKTREKLSDEEMGNLLSAVGNHEAKALTLILMRNGNIYTGGDLYREALNAQGQNKGWIMSKRIPFNYCSYTLAPIGLVAKETLNPDLSIYGYQITEKGRGLGIPLAGLLLDFSERHNIPLNLLFGATGSPSELDTVQTEEGDDIEFRKRAPSTTLRMFYELLTSELPIREKDLGAGMGEDFATVLLGHLVRLSKLGLIQYDAIKKNRHFSSYRLSAVIPEGELPAYRDQPTLTKLVFDILRNNPDQYLAIQDVYDLLSKGQKERLKNREVIRSQISNTLSFLAKHKYADREKFYHDRQSEINITDEQKAVLTELLEIMFRFQNQDKEIFEKGRKLAQEIIVKPDRVSKLLRRAREASSRANQSPQEETQGKIVSIVLSFPNGITTKGIQQLLEERYDKRIGVERINRLSSILVTNGTIKVEKEGNLNRFYPNSKDSSAS